MDNIVTATLTALIEFAVSVILVLLIWMSMHRYALLIWLAAFGGLGFAKSNPNI